ncbi:copper amine oxidase-like protein [Fontibacillus phaseoli]|uniref:Copper amine oxidase-like protein n=1 Tax=Fontibacillus phaseoli TaxID=1416533 RepID=A0A369BKP0_9BACL|nr:copper amine oxidase N-terminal domain-containing protein [Fontibacillus phaseoli]RCX21695.1 copper amine oxidase-like protein [Fontibacillus phaseoli]
MICKSRLSRLCIVVSIAVLTAITAGSLSSSSAIAAGSVKPAQSSSEIKVTMNGNEFQPQSAPYVKNGTVFLPLRDIGELLGTVVFWSSSSKTVTMTYPELTVALHYGSGKATINGKDQSLAATPEMIKGRIYVPLRFLSEATGAKVKWNAKTQTVSITHSDNFVKGGGVNTTAWVNRSTGELYIAHPYEQSPVLAGKVNADFQEYVSINSFITSSGSMILGILDNYGEPHIHYGVYGILVHDNKIVAQKKASYSQRYEENAIYYQYLEASSNRYVERSLLTDGQTLSVYDTEGNEVETYNLPELAGKDETYAVLGAGKDYIVVRPNGTGLLTVINLKDNSSVELAEKLLTGDDLEYAQGNDVPYRGDELKFLGLDTATGLLGFSYVSPFDSKQEVQLFSYNLKTGETGVMER